MPIQVQIIQLDAPLPSPVANGIVATAGGQSVATPLTASINIITLCPQNGGVLLLAGGPQLAFNRCGTGQALLVFPGESTQIEAFGVNVPISLPDGSDAAFVFDGVATFRVLSGAAGSIASGGYTPVALTDGAGNTLSDGSGNTVTG